MAREILYGDLKGFDEFDKKLRELPTKVENRVLQKSVSSAMRSIRSDMVQAAPKHIDERSPASKAYGTIKQNIKVKRLRRVRKGQKGARIDTGKAFWAVFYELGTRHQRARPFFAPTFRRLTDRILRVLGEELGKGIENEAKL